MKGTVRNCAKKEISTLELISTMVTAIEFELRNKGNKKEKHEENRLKAVVVETIE